MSETTTNTPQENVQDSVQENVQAFNPFSDSAWSETPDLANNVTQQQPEATTASSPNTQEEYE